MEIILERKQEDWGGFSPQNASYIILDFSSTWWSQQAEMKRKRVPGMRHSQWKCPEMSIYNNMNFNTIEATCNITLVLENSSSQHYTINVKGFIATFYQQSINDLFFRDSTLQEDLLGNVCCGRNNGITVRQYSSWKESWQGFKFCIWYFLPVTLYSFRQLTKLSWVSFSSSVK